MIQDQILQINTMRIIWQLIRRIYNEILGLKGSSTLERGVLLFSKFTLYGNFYLNIPSVRRTLTKKGGIDHIVSKLVAVEQRRK